MQTQSIATKRDELEDQPSSFSYKCTKARQGKNEIRAIQNREGVWTTNPMAIKEEFVVYFIDLFSSSMQPERLMSLRNGLGL